MAKARIARFKLKSGMDTAEETENGKLHFSPAEETKRQKLAMLKCAQEIGILKSTVNLIHKVIITYLC